MRTQGVAQGLLLNTPITYLGRELEKEYVHIYVYVNQLAVQLGKKEPQTTQQHGKPPTLQ